MGLVDKLISKYRHTANLFCEDIHIQENDEHPTYEKQLVGKNCSVKVAGMTFEFDNVKANCNGVSSSCDIKNLDPNKLTFSFGFK